MFWIKVAVSAFIIVILSELAKRVPCLSGVIAAMPLTTLLVIIWLKIGKSSSDIIISFSKGVIIGIVPTIIFFVLFIILLKKTPFITSLLLSILAWLIVVLIFQKLGIV
ncbi:MAG: DUF3147 family protein [Deltaproteobacteria bacterium]|nr:DUF3147 family protein [Deltaproteobacteria bacterium]